MAKYGNTWWGKKWLEAFNGIDYSNRLPRGRSYANRGYAHSIEVSGNHVTALVQGSRRRPYKVEISLLGFSKKEKERIRQTILTSPTLLSQFLTRNLSESLHATLEKEGISLFPSNWKDVNADCSCPDWAVPCKHIAAVIYLIANEIDKNPFLVFTLNDCNLFELIDEFGEGALENVQQVTPIESLFKPDKKKHEDFDQEVLNSIDLSKIPDLGDHICTILTGNPQFYEKDFRDILKKVYKHWQKHGYTGFTQYSQDEEPEESFSKKWDYPERWQSFSMTVDESHHLVALNNHLGECFKEDDEDLHILLPNLLCEIPPSIIHTLTEELRFLHLLNQFALKLFTQGAIIPQILQNQKGRAFIRWIPALFDPAINDVYQELVRICPSNLVTFQGQRISQEEQVKSALATILGTYVAYQLPKSLSKHSQSDVGLLFFYGVSIIFDEFSTK